MSNRDPYSDSVEFCFTLKTYLKGAPFYNASACRKFHQIGTGKRYCCIGCAHSKWAGRFGKSGARPIQH
jgi:hypothetical protein